MAGSAARFEILGPLRASLGETQLDLGPVKQRAVLMTLLVFANRPVTAAQIVDAVWQDDPPANGANVVQKYVAGLRRVLEPERVPRGPGEVLALTDAGYVLTVEPNFIDADLFRQLVRQASEQREAVDLAEASVLLERALALWRGPALAGLSGPVFDAARTRLLEAKAAAVQAWAEVELLRGNTGLVATRLPALVTEFPLREELHYLSITALFRSGRRAEALAAYRDARRTLVDELGVEPGERLRELNVQILRAEPVVVHQAPPPPAEVVAIPARRPDVVAIPTPPPAAVPHTPAPTSGLPLMVAAAGVEPAASSGLPTWASLLIAAGIPVVSCGTAGWAVVAYHAARRRSRGAALAAAGYLGLLFVAVALVDVPDGRWAQFVRGIGVFALGVTMLGSATHAAVLAPRRDEPRPSADQIATRVRREQARRLAAEHPSIALTLRIGRPDLPRTFDDGGLVDLNSAPEYVLMSLPGVGLDRAYRIAQDRAARGPLSTVDELVARGLVPPADLAGIAEAAVALPPP